MKLIATIAVLSVAMSTGAFAAAQCSTSPAAKFQPQATLESQLKAAGMNVRRVKTEKGCYEVYAIDKTGKKVNLAFNAETLEKVDNPEAGEN
ncbi:PepSY domain-containing protein [Aestuariivirga sp.]|uniref:PepSY domain-containing protein n=1 Tax=Aestuariivirga sp. TaxID=2650926 RepID=UPI00301717CC